MKKNYALDPNYIVVNFRATCEDEQGGRLKIGIYERATGLKLGRFGSFDKLTIWAKKLGGNFELCDEAGGHGHYYRARMIDDKPPPKPIGSAVAEVVNNAPSDYF